MYSWANMILAFVAGIMACFTIVAWVEDCFHVAGYGAAITVAILILAFVI